MSFHKLIIIKWNYQRVTYATTLFGYAKELELAYSKEELTEKLADRFEKGVRHAFTGQQVKTKSTLLQILTDYNDDKRDQNRKTNHDQNKSEIKSDERSEKYSQSHNQNQNKNKNQQRKSWQTRNINATQIQNNNKSSTQMSHDDLDIFGIEVEATLKSENWM